MPTRLLKPGVRDSDTINSLSPQCEVLFYRLLVTVDDFGRYDARPAMIKSQCFPIKDAVTANVCAELLNELSRAGLVCIYDVNGKPYLQMLKWDNVPRAKESKFPPMESGCEQMFADAEQVKTNVPLTVTVTVTDTDTETKTETQTPVAPAPAARAAKGEYPPEFELAWAEYPKRYGSNPKNDAHRAWNARTKEGVGTDVLLDATRRYAEAMKAKGKTSTEFVMQAVKFFGPGGHYLTDWKPPTSRTGLVTDLSTQNYQDIHDNTF